MIIKFCLVFPKIFLLHKVVRDARKVEKHWARNCMCFSWIVHAIVCEPLRLWRKMLLFIAHCCVDCNLKPQMPVSLSSAIAFCVSHRTRLKANLHWGLARSCQAQSFVFFAPGNSALVHGSARQLLGAIKQTKNRARLLLATPQWRLA